MFFGGIYTAREHGCAEIPDLFRVLKEISCSTREINLVFPSTRVFSCLLYKLQVFHKYKMSRSYDW